MLDKRKWLEIMIPACGRNIDDTARSISGLAEIIEGEKVQLAKLEGTSGTWHNQELMDEYLAQVVRSAAAMRKSIEENEKDLALMTEGLERMQRRLDMLVLEWDQSFGIGAHVKAAMAVELDAQD